MQSLATRKRPQSWAEVVGQPTIVSILQRQVATNTWKNAYLFAGAYGTGKTTTALLLDKAINGEDSEPIMLDCATNNGVDFIRDLTSQAQMSPLSGVCNTYILDEGHMLTNAAWNAMLKTLEEPPEHTIFIICTTEPDKLPATILSRVQRFDFRQIPKDDIADRLEFILNEDINIPYDRGALERIATLSKGHMRDAIQYMETCLNNCDNLTIDVVETTLGLVKYDSIIELEKAICDKDIKKCIEVIDHIASYGCDMLKVFDSFISFVLDCNIYRVYGDCSKTDIPSTYKDKIIKSDILTTLLTRLVEYRRNADKTNAMVLLKTICVEMCQ